MTDDDSLLREIFHEAREALSAEADITEPEESISQVKNSWENLNIAASDTWKSHEDSYKFVCRKIKTRAVEIENRMKKVTSADILASLKVYVQTNVPVTKKTRPKNASPEAAPVKKKVRFIVPEEHDFGTSSDNGIEEDSLLYCIRQWYDPTAASPHRNLLHAETKAPDAHCDADRLGSPGGEVTYNNPFDPRLTFDGLAGHITESEVEPKDKDPGGNILLWIDKVTDVVDECLYKYTRYLKSLRQEPFVVKKASAKSELLATTFTDTSNVSSSKNEPSHKESSGRPMSDVERLIRQICSVRKIWDESREMHGSFIPRRITSRKPALVSRRRTPFVSQIKPSAWPNLLVLSRDTSDTLSTEHQSKDALSNSETNIQEESHFTPTEPVENEQKAPSIWQKIAKEHIDDESLKHIQNATKERAGVKIMKPTLSSNDQMTTDEKTKTSTTSKTSALSTMSKPDSWAARVAQIANPVTISSSSSKNNSTHAHSNDRRETPKPCTESKESIPCRTWGLPASTGNLDYSKENLPKEDTKITLETRKRNSPVTHIDTGTTVPVTTCPEEPKTTSSPKSNTTWKDVASVARNSGPNLLNSSTDWFKRLIVGKPEGTTEMKHTIPSHSATVLSSKELSSNTSRDRPTVESKSEPNTGVPQHTTPPAAEFRHRLPPGFEKTILETRITTPSGPPPSRAVHVPQGHHWQVPGTMYAGVSETFQPSAPAYQPAQPRIVHHQFQRPIAQLRGNLAIFHPRPNHGSYMLTDANGKTIGMGIPTWNRVDLQGRPHVLVHQAPVPSASSIRASVHQPHIFPTGASENYLQPNFVNNLPPLPYPQPPKLTEPLITPHRPSTGYERGDHFPGYLPSAMQSSQTNYPGGRLAPQFLPPVHQVQPMVQEYMLFTPNQHKLNPPFLKPHSTNSNNNCSTNSEGTVSVVDNFDTNEKTVRAIVRRPVKLYKVSRVVRTNLIQLA